MVLDANILKEKLIEAWKLRSSDTSFSASLGPLIAECRSEEEFRSLFTSQILAHIDSAISSNLLQSYFKFHARSGYINESLVIERLLSLTPLSSSVTTDDVQIKFLLELLFEILKSMNITAEQAPRLGKQLNLLAKWLCSALCIYSNQLNINEQINTKEKEMLILVSNLFLLLFTNTTYYCLWLMIIKAQKEQNEWKQLQERLELISKRIPNGENSRPDVYEQILFKITRLHLSEEFHQEDIEFNVSIFNPIVSMLVINKLHKSSSVLLLILRFYEHVSTTSNPSLIYLRLLQASFGGYLSSISTNNSEYQQRWSAYIHFQLPRILASCLETQFDIIKQSIETFLLHNEYLLNRMDELCLENVFEKLFQTTLSYTKTDVKEKNDNKINQLIFYIQQIRLPYIQQIQRYYQNHQINSYPFQVLQLQRSLEKSLQKSFSAPNDSENLQNLINSLTDYIPLICALDQYYDFVHLLLSYTQTQFDLALYVLCYITSITDDTSEDFGQINISFDKTSSSYVVYMWLKKYWLSRHFGHALFASSLHSMDFLSTINGSLNDDVLSTAKEEFLMDIKSFTSENMQIKYSNIEYLSKTIYFLGELQSLSLTGTKDMISQLIKYLTHVSYGSLLHVLLWLVANYQIANDNEKSWIQDTIHTMGSTGDSNSTIVSLFDAIKRQLWSDYIDNPLVSYYSIGSGFSTIANNLSLTSSQTSTSIIQTLFETYITNEFLNCEQSRALYICSKYVPIDSLVVRLLTNINTSNGIYETGRALYFILGLILFRRRSSTRCLLKQVLPYLFNVKSNEFMLEPNVYTTCFILNILLTLELNQHDSQLQDSFRVKSWKEMYSMDDVVPKYDDTSVIDAYYTLLNSSSEELFSSETLRPVNYFLGWFQTILWMFSRTVKSLKPFVKPKLVAQLSEYLPLQFPIEKVLSILELSDNIEIEYATMVITRDYTHLKTLSRRTTRTLVHNQQLTINDNTLTITSTNISKNIFSIPKNL
ncbi:unnamed protein product [Rotaria magnacalcarata]|uniref:Uncharacterized protein n=1 Tax=Rotaria magnacalcarata TaxID=392030 RepID=A0A814VZU8_9BILA|nr:unnamed protein product [Rotaria magnacalcarata]CAF1590313.1 unnamed protein product [Rotaria magnacalcarata]CAF1995097.1 unnamed protein product [Rotaria magnacalcarata]CAF3806583.1 unnamed protein product [Rotaria magnacalcarata]CAF3839150.1 unnamed protein product [Rotaria magnacalcarata]